MSKIIIIQLAYIVVIIAQALYNKAVIDAQNYAANDWQKKDSTWHKYDGISTGLTIVLIAYLSNWWWMVLCLALLRFLLFSPILNFIRDKPIDYLSDRGFDGLIKKIPFSIRVICTILLILAINYNL